MSAPAAPTSRLFEPAIASGRRPRISWARHSHRVTSHWTSTRRRLQATFAAHTTAELHEVVADLPLDRIRRNDPQRQQARRRAARRGVQIHLAAYLAMVVIVLTVWLAVGLTAGAWYFWPIWPILGAGIGVIGHALPIRYAMPGLCHRAPMVHGR